MKKKVLFVMPGLYSGGAEKSLVNLLNLLDYSKLDVDLLLFKKEGLFMNQVPSEVNILNIPISLKYSHSPLDGDALKSFSAVKAGANRVIGTLFSRICYGSNQKQMRWKIFYTRVIEKLEGHYDVAVAYLHGEASYYVIDKVCADKKILWVHNDYDKIDGEDAFYKAYFNKADYVVSISTRCVEILQKVFPDISGKFCMLPNLTSSSFVKKMSGEYIPKEYETDIPVLLSIGRLSRQKGFDYAIDAAALLKKAGYRFKWYVLGIGELQEELETRIQEKEVDDCFKLLGNRENPYPYIKNCTIVVQSSRFEGKSVVLDEAKILAKPIVVTNYATVKDQITDGKEGLVVSMTPKGIADGIEKMLTDSALSQNIKEYLSAHEYGNQEEVQKYMELIEGR